MREGEARRINLTFFRRNATLSLNNQENPMNAYVKKLRERELAVKQTKKPVPVPAEQVK